MLNAVEKSAEGIVGRGAPAEGRNDEDEGGEVKSDGRAPESRRAPAVATPRGESAAGEPVDPKSGPNFTLWDRVLTRANLQRALKQVRQNQGAPGVDGMSVDALPDYLRRHWTGIRARLVTGSYRPQPVRRVEIPKPDGRKRLLGIPTVLDRFIQQAIAQVIQAQWEPHFHPKSYGFRPQRSAHQAVRQLQADIREGYGWIVDLDLEAFFDRVNHDRLVARLKRHVPDRALLRLINRYLEAGVRVGERIEATTIGVPQGAHCRQCSPTLCWMNWTGNWNGAATALLATQTTATLWSKANARAGG
jgi:retron-type reverse transcriptase